MGTFTQMAEDWKRLNQAPAVTQLHTASTSTDIPADDPAAWRDAFWCWIEAECVFRQRCFGGIGSLHVHFCEWAKDHDSVPSTRQTFERLLADAGFLIADGMVSELVLAEDWRDCYQPGRGKP
jgi:hypothetical protein